MLLDLHYKTHWEQHDRQSSSLASTTHQTLDKTYGSVLISGLLADVTRSRSDLIVENALLRQQLIVLYRQIKRPQLTNRDRFLFVFLASLAKFWKQSMHIVQPDTLLRWHRELFRVYWRRKSQGQPKISAEAIELIRKMSKENRLWERNGSAGNYGRHSSYGKLQRGEGDRSI